MICKPNRLAFALLAPLSLWLAGCEDVAEEQTPLDAALAMLARGDGIGAEEKLREALDNGATPETVAAYLGEAELLQGELAEARSWLVEGQFDDATRAHGFHMLARLEMRDGNLPAAGQAFDQALKSDSEDPELWVDIGRLRYIGGEQVQAVEAADYAVELGPQNPNALHFRGQLVRDAHGMEAALPWFEAALKLQPENAMILLDLAATQGELGQAKAMLSTIRKLAKIDPGNRQMIYLQAVLAARAGKPNLARSLLQRSGGVDRQVPAAMLLSGVIDLQNGNDSAAAQTLEKLANRQPENRRVKTLLARALMIGGNDEELVHRFAADAQRPSAPPYLTEIVGRAYERLGEREKAAVLLDRAAQPRNTNLIALQGSKDRALAALRDDATGDDKLALIRDLIVTGQTGAAINQSETFLKQYAGSADATSLAGDAQLARKNAQAALERYQTSANVRRSWHLTRRMIMTLRALGQGNEAEALVARHLRGEPGNVEATSLMAAALTDVQKWDAAGLLLDHAMAIGGSRDPRLVALRARVALAQGDPQGALFFAERAYAMQPGSPLTTNILVLARNEAGADGTSTEFLMAKARALGAS
jgi:tetratricopeptide (TPR) repeat protein